MTELKVQTTLAFGEAGFQRSLRPIASSENEACTSRQINAPEVDTDHLIRKLNHLAGFLPPLCVSFCL
jgi:hypothetical protein